MASRLNLWIRENSSSDQSRVIPALFIPKSEFVLHPGVGEYVTETEAWTSAQKSSVFDERVLKALHKKMFGHIWHWAGEFRLSQDRRGADFFLIPGELGRLTLECANWAGERAYPPDTIAVQWFFGLVRIRPFLDGNARHARLATDLLLARLGRPPFTWGMVAGLTRGDAGEAYDSALMEAKDGNMGPLLKFARS